MSFNTERDQFLARLAREVSPEVASSEQVMTFARAVLRAATTLQRLAEAQCNGDYPADNGDRKVEPCSVCEMLWVPSSMSRRAGAYVCKDCTTAERVARLCKPFNITPHFQGDPRGAVVRLAMPGQTRESDYVYVPTRG